MAGFGPPLISQSIVYLGDETITIASGNALLARSECFVERV
jgi:hypothetical protein